MPHSKGWRDPSPERSPDPALVGDVLGALLRRRPFLEGMAVGRLARDWENVVGERLARATAPVRLEGGTLVVAASAGAWGAQAAFLAEEIRKRAVEALGGTRIDRVQVVVDADLGSTRKTL